MRFHWLRAAWQCDGCGKDFIVEIDQGEKIPEGWDLVDIARDAIRGGHCIKIEAKHSHIITGLANSCSVQAELNLCPDCTSIADDIGDDDYRPTRKEILSAIAAKEASNATS